MNFKHAVGFLFLGTLCGLMPRLAPGWSHVVSVDSSSTRELWLQFMSFVQIGLAGIYFLRRLAAYLATVLEYDTANTATTATAYPEAPGEIAAATQSVALVPVRRPALASRLRSRTVLPIPVAFESGLLDPRRAA